MLAIQRDIVCGDSEDDIRDEAGIMFDQLLCVCAGDDQVQKAKAPEQQV